MTKEEFLEKYGDVEVVFHDYYKFSFTFDGRADDGTPVDITVGGNPETIYRFNVRPNTPTTVDDLVSGFPGEVSCCAGVDCLVT